MKLKSRIYSPVVISAQDHEQIQERQSCPTSRLFINPLQCSVIQRLYQPLIEFLGVYLAGWYRGYCVPGKCFNIPFMVKVVQILQMYRDLSVMSWRCESITPEVH